MVVWSPAVQAIARRSTDWAAWQFSAVAKILRGMNTQIRLKCIPTHINKQIDTDD
jgi:hypothetical protein